MLKLTRILIVDDEMPARRKLRGFLRKIAPDSHLLEAENGLEAFQLIKTDRPQLVFLDIQMPGMTGFELIHQVGMENMPPVIFVTAYDRYAIKAFEIQAVDYLLKPFDEERFLKSFEHFRKRNSDQQHQQNIFRALIEKTLPQQYLERLIVEKKGRYHFITVSQIQYITAAEKYIEIHTPDRKYLMRNSLKRIESQLNPAQFARIHRSHIVNLDQVKEIQPWSHGDSIVILKNNIQLPMSRRYRERVFK